MCIPSFKILAIIVPEKTVTQKILLNYGITKSSIAPLFQSGAIMQEFAPVGANSSLSEYTPYWRDNVILGTKEKVIKAVFLHK